MITMSPLSPRITLLVTLALLFALLASSTEAMRSRCPNRCEKSYRAAYKQCRRGRRFNTACGLTRCVLRRGHRRRISVGWACTPRASTPSTSPSLTPLPSSSTIPSQTPVPSLEPLPSTPETFSSATFLSSVHVADDRTESATDGSGNMFRISYDATLAADGVVSLSGLADQATITCNTDGSIRIRLADGAPEGTSVLSMYPAQAVLVVSREIFGECLLAQDDLLLDETDDERELRLATDSNAALFRDSFLLIESVSGTPTDAIVRGSPTTFFALFDQARISVHPVDSTEEVVRESGTEPVSALSIPTTSRAVRLNFESDLAAIGPLKLRLNGEGVSKGQFLSFEAEWDITDVNIEFKFINEWELNVDIDARFSAGLGASKIVKNILSLPLYGLPPIDFLSKLDTGRVTLPTFKLGFYFEIPLIISFNAKVEKVVANVAKASYSTTRTEVTLFFRGPYIDVDVGANTRVLTPSSSNFSFEPKLETNNPAEVTFDLFAGIRPQFAAYVPVFRARVSVEAGVQFNGQYDSPKSSAFKPLPVGGRNFGICSECHDLQIDASGIIRNAGFFASMVLDIKVMVWRLNVSIPIIKKRLTAITLPGNPNLSIDLAKGCFIMPMGDARPVNYLVETDTCAQCPDTMPIYNGSSQKCEQESTPGPSPTPSLTPTPAPSRTGKPSLAPSRSSAPSPATPSPGTSLPATPSMVPFSTATPSQIPSFSALPSQSVPSAVTPSPSAPSPTPSISAPPAPPANPFVESACIAKPSLSNGSGFSSSGRADERDAVRGLQILLNTLNGAGIDADGLFGDSTEASVRAWQTREGLGVDGIVGPLTWNSLCVLPLPA